MIAQASPSSHGEVHEEEKPITDKILDVLLPIVGVAAVGFAIPAAFWGIWYAIAGSIPKFLGYSRFWLDAVSGAFYIPILVLYVIEVICERDNLQEEDEDDRIPVSFWDFVTERPWLSLAGLFLAIDFVASIFFSFATGLAGIIALAAVIGLGYGIWYVIMVVYFVASQGYNHFLGIEDEEEQTEET